MGFYYDCSMAKTLSAADFQCGTIWDMKDANKQLLSLHVNINGKSILFCLRTAEAQMLKY